MKKNKKDIAQANDPQTGKSVKKDLPIKNAMTDGVKNAALQSQGLNQLKTTRDDLLPSDGDNLTNN